MLLSMTGHGHGSHTDEGLSISVEIRTVNSRYVKVNVRCSDNYQVLEPQVEDLVRKSVKRGTVQINIRVDRKSAAGRFSVNEEVLAGYIASAQNLAADGESLQIGQLMGLPGVIEESTDATEKVQSDWNLIKATLTDALNGLTEMRKAEGESMGVDLARNCDSIEAELATIKELAPQVAAQYQNRLVEKLNQLLADNGVEVESSDVIREVGVFADRTDISEETVRLQTHIEQFRKVMEQAESQGRKLDFLTQEMFRETNTIGSKANDAAIAQRVVEIKTAIERIREMVQNIE